MPSRLRPTAPIAADAILVGDPGRALLLAQELLEQPKMSNHARGLWGYSGRTPAGGELTIQSTGIGGPSAALVLADLAELGVRRAVRVGTCVAAGAGGLGRRAAPGRARRRRAAAPPPPSGSRRREEALPDPGLTESLRAALGESGRPATVASFDVAAGGRRATRRRGRRRRHADGRHPGPGRRRSESRAAAVLIVDRIGDSGSHRRGGSRGRRAKRAGRAASARTLNL